MINVMKHEINICISMLTLWELTFWTIRTSEFVPKISIDKSLCGSVQGGKEKE
jgi:hypothetical protein